MFGKMIWVLKIITWRWGYVFISSYIHIYIFTTRAPKKHNLCTQEKKDLACDKASPAQYLNNPNCPHWGKTNKCDNLRRHPAQASVVGLTMSAQGATRGKRHLTLIALIRLFSGVDVLVFLQTLLLGEAFKADPTPKLLFSRMHPVLFESRVIHTSFVTNAAHVLLTSQS